MGAGMVMGEVSWNNGWWEEGQKARWELTSKARNPSERVQGLPWQGGACIHGPEVRECGLTTCQRPMRRAEHQQDRVLVDAYQCSVFGNWQSLYGRNAGDEREVFQIGKWLIKRGSQEISPLAPHPTDHPNRGLLSYKVGVCFTTWSVLSLAMMLRKYPSGSSRSLNQSSQPIS